MPQVPAYPPPQYRGYRYFFGTASITYQTLRYDSESTNSIQVNTGTRHFGKLGTTSVPVLSTSLGSVRRHKIPRISVYPTERTLRFFDRGLFRSMV